MDNKYLDFVNKITDRLEIGKSLVITKLKNGNICVEFGESLGKVKRVLK